MAFQQVRPKYTLKNDRFLNVEKTKTTCELSAYVAFNKATNGETDIKHEQVGPKVFERSIATGLETGYSEPRELYYRNSVHLIMWIKIR